MKTKKELRKEILDQRKQLTPEDVQSLSERIYDNVRGLGEYRQAEKICLYMPIRNEVDVMLLADQAAADGKMIFIPKVTGDEMIFNLYDPENIIEDGPFHIRESGSEVILDSDDRVLILMPGSVFDRNCGRIGYGGGYYDKYLAAHPGCMTAAVCYSFQIIEEDLPSEEHDIRPQMVVSECGVLRRPSA